MTKEWQSYVGVENSIEVADSSMQPRGMSDDEELLRAFGHIPVGEEIVDLDEDWRELGLTDG